jgi:predicted transposase YdaD
VEQDTTLKLLIQDTAVRVFPLLGIPCGVKSWLNVELPTTQNLKVDLLAELLSGELQHFELQSTQIIEPGFRLLEYGVGIKRLLGRFPRQALIYCGNDRLRMENVYCAPGLEYRFDLIDLKTLDGRSLLESENVSDNLMGLLMALDNREEAVRRILKRIIRLEQSKRESALTRFLVTCGMRKLGPLAAEEIKKMPVGIELLMEDEFFQSLVRQGREEGRVEGREEGRELGHRDVLCKLVEKRFGTLPEWVETRVNSSSDQEINDIIEKTLTASTLEQLFGTP